MDIKPQCQYCEKTFCGKSNLLKHLRIVHKVQNKDEAYLCLESGCDSKFSSSKKLRDHLKMMHDLKFEEEYLEFKDIAAFNFWKNEYKEKEDVKFIKSSGVKRGLNGERKYYLNCHRSGYGRFVENPTKIRRGSHKLGFYCTSSMTVVEKVDGKVTCMLYPTHYGHPNEIGELNLTANEKQIIAAKMHQKFNADDIVEDIRDHIIHKGRQSRTRLTTKEDKKNIKRKYNLYGNKIRLISNRHKKSLVMDFSSVDQKDGNYVVNSSFTNEQYTVRLNTRKCQCKIRCHACGYCIHEITCTCEDYLIKNVLCKHCHLVIRKIKDEFEEINLESEDDFQSKMGLEQMADTDESTDIHNIHKLIKVKSNHLEECKLLLRNISAQLCEIDPEESGVSKKAYNMLRDVNDFLMASSSNINNTEKFPPVKCEAIKVHKDHSILQKRRSGRKKNKFQKGTSKEKEETHAEIIYLSCTGSAPENTADYTYYTEE